MWNYCTDSSRFFLGDSPSRSFKCALCPLHWLHFHPAILRLAIQLGLSLSLSGPKALVPFFVLLLETEVSWGLRSGQNSDPVLDEISLSERSMSFGRGKPSRGEILSGCFAFAGKQKMIHPQREWVHKPEK